MHSEQFTMALYNLIDLKVIDIEEFEMLQEHYETCDDINDYLELRENVQQSLIACWYLVVTLCNTQCPLVVDT